MACFRLHPGRLMRGRIQSNYCVNSRLDILTSDSNAATKYPTTIVWMIIDEAIQTCSAGESVQRSVREWERTPRKRYEDYMTYTASSGDGEWMKWWIERVIQPIGRARPMRMQTALYSANQWCPEKRKKKKKKKKLFIIIYVLVCL